MPCRALRLAGAVAVSAVFLLLVVAEPRHVRADAFDQYVNPTLAKLVESKDVKEIKQLTPGMIVEHDRVLPKLPSAFLVVRTNGNRLAKLLVQAGKQRID